jgi:hypothetical protein
MQDDEKTKEQLIDELNEMLSRVLELLIYHEPHDLEEQTCQEIKPIASPRRKRLPSPGKQASS